MVFETTLNEGDEQSFSVDLGAADAPTSWTVLAQLGPSMCQSGAGTIVEMVTQNGTTILFDGSANTYDAHDYWNQTRRDVLVNELLYLLP